MYIYWLLYTGFTREVLTISYGYSVVRTFKSVDEILQMVTI